MTECLPGLYRFEDTCAVYLLVDGDEALAIDYGSGDWRSIAAAAGLPAPTTVLLTHHHADQCAGLAGGADEGLAVHAAGGERAYLERASVAAYWAARDSGGVPASYSVLPEGLDGVGYDLGGFADYWWGLRRIRCLHTPGHGPQALSFVVDWAGEQVVFSGDAVHAGGTVWQPYCLEWDHWTGEGALAAWQGLQRLGGIAVDRLCPSHGPVIDADCRAVIATTAGRLLDLVHAKGQIAAGMPDCYFTPRRRLACGALELHPRLYQFGANSYLLLDGTGSEALVIDPYRTDIDRLAPLLGELPALRITATTATHYHYDHCDALDDVRRAHGAQVLLHPRVAAILHDPAATDCPWRPAAPILADTLLPEDGDFRWADLALRCAPFPGQTWWHCLLMVELDGERWAFAGDNIQPPSRWNGTGGFCSYNGSRFASGFAGSAQRLLDWQPTYICNGHGTFQTFHAPTYAAIRDWSARAEHAVRALCPSGDPRQDYYLHDH